MGFWMIKCRNRSANILLAGEAIAVASRRAGVGTKCSRGPRAFLEGFSGVP